MEKGALPRLHYVDALRGFAMVLVIPWHAANFFAIRGEGGMPLAGWIWTSHTFRMPLFFLIAGFFGTAVLARRGSAEWVRSRLVRLGIPLAVGVVVLIPVAGLLASWGAAEDPGIDSLGSALSHAVPHYLWFLWYLLIVSAVWLAVRAPVARWVPTASLAERLRGYSISPWAVLALAAPCALALWSTGDWSAIPRDSYSAPPGLLVYYGVFFAFGWLLGGRVATLEGLGRHPYRHLAMGAAVAVPGFWLFVHSGEPGIAGSPALRLLALYLGALCCWLLIDGLIGIFRRHFSGESPTVRYIADASYWLYLSHMLFLAPLQLLLFGMVVPGAAQFALAVTATLALTLITYELFVRYSAVGRILHGPRSREEAPDDARDRGRSELAVSQAVSS